MDRQTDESNFIGRCPTSVERPKWKSATDKEKSFGALMTDLSKTFNCLQRELLIAKLHAYGFSLAVLKLVISYLSNRKQRPKKNESYSS